MSSARPATLVTALFRRRRAGGKVSLVAFGVPFRVAALDCGTNSTRLLIADSDGSPIARRMQVTRLGEGVDASRRLNPEAVKRTLVVLEEYRQLMDETSVQRARLVATSAARDATNSDEFFRAAEEVTGVPAELLSGQEEGRLSFLGATALLPRGWDRERPVLVVDIGGGSTELVGGSPSNPGNARAVSMDIGCVRLTERFLTDDPPTRSELVAARAAVDEALGGAASELPELDPGGPVIGLAGTVSTLASLAGQLEIYDRERIHHVVLPRQEVHSWLSRLASEDVEARRRRPGMDPGRADVIVGGVLVLAAVMDDFDRGYCLVSEDDILDGLVASLL